MGSYNRGRFQLLPERLSIWSFLALEAAVGGGEHPVPGRIPAEAGCKPAGMLWKDFRMGEGKGEGRPVLMQLCSVECQGFLDVLQGPGC